jgi:hypothetical protein
MRVKLSILATTTCALLLAFPLAAANGPAAKTNTSKHMTKTAVMRSAWAPETLSGKIAMVDPAQNLMVVELPNGVPFDMVVASKTRIKSGNQALTLKEPTQDSNKTVSVRFIPERRGDVAKSIQIGG